MSISSAITDWIRSLMAPARDPRLSYQHTLERHQMLIHRVGQARSSLRTAQARLEAQLADLRQSQVAAGCDEDDPFEQQLLRIVAQGVADLEEELAELRREEEGLELAERRLLVEERALKAKQEAVTAHQIASQARSRVSQQLSGPATSSSHLAPLIEEAERRADGVQEKLAVGASLAGVMTFAGTSEAQGLAVRFVAAARTEASPEHKRLLADGLRCLLDLEAEHTQLQGLRQRSVREDFPAGAYIQTLASEAYNQALRLLSDALDLLVPPHRDAEEPSLSAESSQSPSTKVDFASILQQAERCSAALRQTHLELADMKASGSRKRSEIAIAALRTATRNTRQIEAELETLGLETPGPSPEKESGHDERR